MPDALIHLNNSFAKLEAPAEIQQLASRALSYQIPDYKIIRQRQYQRTRNKFWLKWDGMKSFYDGRNHVFMTGLTGLVVNELVGAGLSYTVVDKRVKPGKIAVDFEEGFRLADPEKKSITLYDYQQKAVRDFIAATRGVAKLATGAGKTEIAISTTKCLNVPTLFLTHRRILMYQTAQRFASRLPHMRQKIGIIGDSEYAPNFITVATVQTLHRMLKKDPEQLLSELQPYRLLIIDEAHRTGSPQFYEVANHCVSAYFRMALTATPFMTENIADDMFLMGVTGPKVVDVTNGELIDRGILARPFFVFININQPKEIGWLKDWQDIYTHGIVNNEYRNRTIVDQIGKQAGEGRKTLCTVVRIPHGRRIAEMANAQGLKTRFISGEHGEDERRTALDQLSRRQVHAIIATNIFDEGVDVKDINCLINAAGNKSAPLIFQRAGRTMRKKEHANYALIIDFIDHQHEKLYDHSCKRYETVKNERGFTIL